MTISQPLALTILKCSLNTSHISDWGKMLFIAKIFAIAIRRGVVECTRCIVWYILKVTEWQNVVDFMTPPLLLSQAEGVNIGASVSADGVQGGLCVLLCSCVNGLLRSPRPTPTQAHVSDAISWIAAKFDFLCACSLPPSPPPPSPPPPSPPPPSALSLSPLLLLPLLLPPLASLYPPSSLSLLPLLLHPPPSPPPSSSSSLRPLFLQVISPLSLSGVYSVPSVQSSPPPSWIPGRHGHTLSQGDRRG